MPPGATIWTETPLGVTTGVCLVAAVSVGRGDGLGRKVHGRAALRRAVEELAMARRVPEIA